MFPIDLVYYFLTKNAKHISNFQDNLLTLHSLSNVSKAHFFFIFFELNLWETLMLHNEIM